jgi:hypothetical protein
VKKVAAVMFVCVVLVVVFYSYILPKKGYGYTNGFDSGNSDIVYQCFNGKAPEVKVDADPNNNRQIVSFRCSATEKFTQFYCDAPRRARWNRWSRSEGSFLFTIIVNCY